MICGFTGMRHVAALMKQYLHVGNIFYSSLEQNLYGIETSGTRPACGYMQFCTKKINEERKLEQ